MKVINFKPRPATTEETLLIAKLLVEKKLDDADDQIQEFEYYKSMDFFVFEFPSKTKLFFANHFVLYDKFPAYNKYFVFINSDGIVTASKDFMDIDNDYLSDDDIKFLMSLI